MKRLNNNKATTRRMALSAGVLTGALVLGGCNSAGEGFFSGAAIGAASGAALGSLDGNVGEGALYGTIIGALGGAILGDQNARNSGHNARDDRRRHSSHHHYDSRYDRRDPWWEDDCDW